MPKNRQEYKKCMFVAIYIYIYIYMSSYFSHFVLTCFRKIISPDFSRIQKKDSFTDEKRKQGNVEKIQ